LSPKRWRLAGLSFDRVTLTLAAEVAALGVDQRPACNILPGRRAKLLRRMGGQDGCSGGGPPTGIFTCPGDWRPYLEHGRAAADVQRQFLWPGGDD